jgi:hypothetical protein
MAATDASIDNGHEQDMTEDPYNGPEHCVNHTASNCNNIVISVKNNDNLEEFSTKTHIEPDYIPKL